MSLSEHTPESIDPKDTAPAAPDAHEHHDAVDSVATDAHGALEALMADAALPDKAQALFEKYHDASAAQVVTDQLVSPASDEYRVKPATLRSVMAALARGAIGDPQEHHLARVYLSAFRGL